MAAVEGFVVGARCCCEGFYATIRFVGEVPPAKGVWVGVEWDDSSRGKHSGHHEGTHFFTCSKPGSGSFVRPRKVSLGYSFIEALRERYADVDDPRAAGSEAEGGGGVGGEEMFVVSRNSLVTPVEMVGADKINKKTSQLGKLGEVSTSVRGMLVSSPGPPGEISAVAPNIQSLDLSSCLLLSSWETVANICRQLEHLKTLNASESCFLSLPDEPCTLTSAFRHVSELSINKIQLSWTQVCSIASMFPGLEKLHCCENSIPNISSQLPLQNLRLLTLEENQLSSWAEVSHLATLPRLETLILNDNQIPEILTSDSVPDRERSDVYFPCLRAISICRNHIHSWSSIVALATLPSLRELKIKGNPLFKGQADLNSRQLVIAELPLIQGLNNSPVGDRERQVAERFYLKQYSSEWVESRGSEEERRRFEQVHPRYATLADTHNMPLEIMLPSQPSVSALKTSLLSVSVHCPEQPEARRLSKRLPGTMTVQKLKGLLQRVYRVDVADQRLTYLDSTRNFEIELGDDLKQLSFYAMESGDTILLRW